MESAPPSEARPTLSYQPALDGIRALAVLAVMLYHGEAAGVPGGFLGVDVFFVLSGFLITTLLLGELRSTGRLELARFWGRRVRRLFPALILLVLGVCLYAAFVTTPDQLHAIRIDGIASLLYVQNWRLIVSGQSYFAQFGAPSPFRHVWSLAIEEQWYLLWPLALIGLVRLVRGNLHRLAVITVALAALSATLMFVLYDPADPSRVYYGTDTRAFALLLGSSLGMIWLRHPGPKSEPARWSVQALGVAAALYLVWTVHVRQALSASLYRGGLALVAVAAAALIAAAMSPGPLRRVLGVRPLAAVGLISYGLYLWHWPIYLALTPTRTGLDGTRLLLVRMAVTFVVAFVSYRLVELPVRRSHWRPRVAWVVIPAAGSVAIFLLFLATSSLVPSADKPVAGPAGLSEAESAALSKAFGQPPSPGDVKVLVAGDSVAETLAYWVPNDPGDGYWARGDSTILGCGIVVGEPVSDGARLPQDPRCLAWADRYRGGVDGRKPDVSALLVGSWELYDRYVDGHLLKIGTAPMERYLDQQLAEAQRVLTSRGARFVLLTTPCFRPTNAGVGGWGLKDRSDPARVVWLNQVFGRYAAAHPKDVTLIDLDRFVCPGGRFADRIDGQPMRTDGVHFSAEGAAVVWKWLGPQLVALGRPAAGDAPKG